MSMTIRNVKGSLAFITALTGLAVLPLMHSARAAENSRQSPEDGRPALNEFRIISERNIFNPKRYARSTNTRRETPRPTAAPSQTLALTGTLAYEKGTFAFFEGSSASMKKAVQANEEVAGLEVVKITPEAVVLVSETNRIELKVGHQLRRRANGPWMPAGEAELASGPAPSLAPAAPQPSAPQPTEEPDGPPEFIRGIIESALGGGIPSPSSGDQSPSSPPSQVAQPSPAGEASRTPASTSGGSQDEILRRLMERREQEMNQ